MWEKALDNALAIFLAGASVVGSAVLLARTLLRHDSPQRTFSCGELALLPASWRRWLLDEKPLARHR